MRPTQQAHDGLLVMSQPADKPDHRLRNLAIGATVAAFVFLALTTAAIASAGPDEMIPGAGPMALFMITAAIAAVAWISIGVHTLNRFTARHNGQHRTLVRSAVWLSVLLVLAIPAHLLWSYYLDHRGLGERAATARDAPRVINSAFGLDEDCQVSEHAWDHSPVDMPDPVDATGAQGMAYDFGRTADPDGIILTCGEGTRAQPCYLLEPRYYACYLPDPGDARYGQWACVFDEDGHPSRIDQYRDFWNAPPCRAAMDKAGFVQGWHGNWWPK